MAGEREASELNFKGEKTEARLRVPLMRDTYGHGEHMERGELGNPRYEAKPDHGAEVPGWCLCGLQHVKTPTLSLLRMPSS